MASKERQVVVGVFNEQNMAERAVQALEDAGFDSDQIGFARRDGTADGQEGATRTEGAGDAGGGAVTGAVTGGVLGGILGAAAALLIPGIGPVVAGGILATTIGGAALGAAAGGLLGALTNMGVPEEEAQYYQGEFEQGRTIVTVRTSDRQREAIDILRRHGAYDATTRNADMAGTTGITTDTTPVGAGSGYGMSQGNASDFNTMEDTNVARNKNQDQFTSGRWDDFSPQYRNFWQQRYGSKGGRWEDFEPTYRYGWEMRNNPQYQNMSWAQAEPNLRQDWETRYPNKPWKQTSSMLRETWDDDIFASQGQGYSDQEGQRVQIREEQLQAQKQPVQTGEVRIGKKVTEEQQSINVPTMREEVFVERVDTAPRPADQPITGNENDTIRVPVVEEQVQVTKQPVVTGEVVVGKRQVQDNQQVTDTVRREEPRIEQQGDVNIQGSGMDQYNSDQPDNRP
jgi:uncharacterized protein (TIGR02271 family)